MGGTARRLAVVAGASLVFALAPTAHAQGGNGLYEPFPKAAVEKRAKRFVERLRFDESTRFSDAELERGTFVGLRATRAGEGSASARAGADRTKSDVPLAAQVLLIALAVSALPLLAGRRPSRSVARS
jgi:hypothetical protein